LDWEVVAAVAAGLAIAGAIMAWPRPALICLGVVSLLLGLLGLATLKVMSIPALVAMLGGVGLIGFGRLIGAVEQLLTETRMGKDRNRAAADRQGPPTSSEVETDPLTSDQRIEPRL
jgi:hypothetical protein